MRVWNMKVFLLSSAFPILEAYVERFDISLWMDNNHDSIPTNRNDEQFSDDFHLTQLHTQLSVVFG